MEDGYEVVYRRCRDGSESIDEAPNEAANTSDVRDAVGLRQEVTLDRTAITEDRAEVVYIRSDAANEAILPAPMASAPEVYGAVVSRNQQTVLDRSNITLVENLNVEISDSRYANSSVSRDETPDILKEKMKLTEGIFVKTRGYECVLETLEDLGHVVIAGSPGSGKTTMSLYIMDKYRKQNYKVQLERNIRTFDCARDVELQRPTLLVFDDVFGHFSATQGAILDYKSVLNDIDDHFSYIENQNSKKQMHAKKTNLLKVIFSTRTSILKNVSPHIKQFGYRLFRGSSIVDLTTLAKLDTGEKKGILNKHLTNKDIKLDDSDINVIASQEYGTLGFPYICRLFVDNKSYQKCAIDFFREPLAYLNQNIVEIFEVEEYTCTAAMMLYLVLKDGKLDLGAVTDVHSFEKEELDDLFRKLQRIIPKLERDCFLPMIKKAAVNQVQTFLRKEGSVVEFSHPTIHDTVAYVVGMKDSSFVLRNCSLTFILNRVKIAKISSQESDYDFTIKLEGQSVAALIERLALEVLSGNFALALSHNCLVEPEYAERLYKEISVKENFHEIVHCTDKSHHLFFLFWVAFTERSALCKLLLQDHQFQDEEILEALLGNCMAGNLQGMEMLMKLCDEELLRRTKSCSLEDILPYHGEQKILHTYHKIASTYDPEKDDLKPTDEYPRMFGDGRDNLIHIATANGNSDIVSALLEAGVNIDSAGGTGMTALMYACYHGYKELAKMLIAKGSDLTLLNEQGDNCLHLASRAGFPAVAELLLESGIDIESRGYYARTSLMFASQHGKLEVVKLLLQKGAQAEPDVSNVMNKDNCLHLAACNGRISIVEHLIEEGKMNTETVGEHERTAVMFACRHGHLKTAVYLHSKKANIHARDGNRNSCLHLAAMGGHNDIVKWLLDKDSLRVHCDKNGLNAYSKTPLMYAFSNNHPGTVKLLLDVGANATSSDKMGNLCIHFAVRSGDESLVQTCLELGQSVDSSNKAGITPLMNACGNGDIPLMEFLLHRKAKSSLCKNTGDTCFHMSCSHGCIDAVKYLHSHCNIDINQPGFKGRTPLLQACNFGHCDVVEYLLDSGADTTIKDKEGKSCSHLAICSDKVELVKLLQDRQIFKVFCDNDQNTPFQVAILSDSAKVVEYLVSREPILLEKRDNWGRNALHIACQNGAIKTAAKLIQSGMDVNSRDKEKKTPLLLSVCSPKSNNDIVNLLIESGADMNLKDKKGNTCLHAAVHASASISVIKGLLDAGIDVNVRGAHGQTPIMLACSRSVIKEFELFLERKADVTLCDDNGATALHYACMNHLDDVYIVSAVIHVYPTGIDRCDDNGKTPAMFSVSRGREYTLKLLMTKGTNLHSVDCLGCSLLHIACRCEKPNMNIIKSLIDNGMDINAYNKKGQTPLMFAAEGGHLNVVKLLIRRGAQVKVTDRDRKTCIHYAAGARHNDLASYLLTLYRRW